MNDNIKYLSDGRKVCVIGAINKTEFIVQEVHVTEDGDEFPTGEKFTSKSLLDVPAKTYKEKEAERIEKLLCDKKSELESIKRHIYDNNQKRLASAELTKQSIKSMESISNLDFEHLIDIVSGNIKFVVYVGYDGMSIAKHKEFEESISYFDRYGSNIRFDGIKLLSLFGRSDGDLAFKINRYGDGSGGDEEVVFIKTEDELKTHYLNTIKIRHDAGRVNISDIEICSEYVDVPEYIIDTLYEKELKSYTEIQEKELLQLRDRHNTQNQRLAKILKLKENKWVYQH